MYAGFGFGIKLVFPGCTYSELGVGVDGVAVACAQAGALRVDVVEGVNITCNGVVGSVLVCPQVFAIQVKLAAFYRQYIASAQVCAIVGFVVFVVNGYTGYGAAVVGIEFAQTDAAFGVELVVKVLSGQDACAVVAGVATGIDVSSIGKAVKAVVVAPAGFYKAAQHQAAGTVGQVGGSTQQQVYAFYIHMRAAFVAVVSARYGSKAIVACLHGCQGTLHTRAAGHVCALVDKGQTADAAFGQGFGLGVGSDAA